MANTRHRRELAINDTDRVDGLRAAITAQRPRGFVFFFEQPDGWIIGEGGSAWDFRELLDKIVRRQRQGELRKSWEGQK